MEQVDFNYIFTHRTLHLWQAETSSKPFVIETPQPITAIHVVYKEQKPQNYYSVLVATADQIRQYVIRDD